MTENKIDAQFECIEAIFKPKNIETLKASGRQFIGERAIFESAWIIDSGPYKDQWAMTIPRAWSERQRAETTQDLFDGFTWVPQEDLEIVRKLNNKERREFIDKELGR